MLNVTAPDIYTVGSSEMLVNVYRNIQRHITNGGSVNMASMLRDEWMEFIPGMDRHFPPLPPHPDWDWGWLTQPAVLQILGAPSQEWSWTRGVVLPLPHTSSWCGARLRTGTALTSCTSNHDSAMFRAALQVMLCLQAHISAKMHVITK
jgi:hypothetical protein